MYISYRYLPALSYTHRLYVYCLTFVRTRAVCVTLSAYLHRETESEYASAVRKIARVRDLLFANLGLIMTAEADVVV